MVMLYELEVSNGLRQGNSLTPILINISLHTIIQRAELKFGSTLFNKIVLVYAGDVVIIRLSFSIIKDTFTRLDEEVKKIGVLEAQPESKFLRTRNFDFGCTIIMLINIPERTPFLHHH